MSTGSSASYLSQSQASDQLAGDDMQRGSAEDEEASRSRRSNSVMAAVRSHFRPEFVNRIDEFAIFDPLRKDQIKHASAPRSQAVGDATNWVDNV